MKKQAPVTLRCLLPSGESNREAGPPAGPAGQSPTHIPPGPGGLAKGSYRHPLKPCPQPTRCFLRSPPGHRCLRLSTHPDQGFSYPPHPAPGVWAAPSVLRSAASLATPSTSARLPEAFPCFTLRLPASPVFSTSPTPEFQEKGPARVALGALLEEVRLLTQGPSLSNSPLTLVHTTPDEDSQAINAT